MNIDYEALAISTLLTLAAAMFGAAAILHSLIEQGLI